MVIHSTTIALCKIAECISLLSNIIFWIFNLTKDFCLLQPEKTWLVPTTQMKKSKDLDARHPALALRKSVCGNQLT